VTNLLKNVRAGFGNPLTYDDWRSQEYGRRRFGHNEGFFGILSRGYGIIEGKRALRSLPQLESQLYAAASIIWSTAINHYLAKQRDSEDLKRAA
jgi:hypothetical protein